MNTTLRKRTYEWGDPLEGAAKAKSMSGFEYLTAINNDEIPPPPLMVTLGFEKPDIKQGEATFYFKPEEYHYNPIGSVHGGVVSAILDSVMGCTLQTTLPTGVGYTTLELKVNFLKAVSYQTGRMIATGRIIHSGKSTALIEGSLADEKGTVYAHGVSTCMLFPFNNK